MSDFRELLLKRIAAVQEQRLSPKDSLTESTLLTDLVTKSQEIAKQLQSQLDSERSEFEAKVKYLQRKYEEEIQALKQEIRVNQGIGDLNARDVRNLLIEEMKSREGKWKHEEKTLKEEIGRLNLEINALKLQFANVKHEKTPEKLEKSLSIEYELHIKQLQNQVIDLQAALDSQKIPLTPSHRSESPSNLSISLLSNPKEAPKMPENWQRELDKLTESKEKAERAVELMLKISSEKEAELTEENERLRGLNAYLQEFVRKQEEEIREKLTEIEGKIGKLAINSGNSMGKEELETVERRINEVKMKLFEVFDQELGIKDQQKELLEAMQLMNRYCEETERSTGRLQVQTPAVLLQTCAELKKELEACRAERLQDQASFSLQLAALSSQNPSEQLLSDLESLSTELISLKSQLNSFQDRHLEDEIRSLKSNLGKINSENQTAKGYIAILSLCIQSLQSIILENNPQFTLNSTEISRFEAENSLLIDQINSQNIISKETISTLNAEIYKLQVQNRQIETKFADLQRLFYLQGKEKNAFHVQEMRLLMLKNEQLMSQLTEKQENFAKLVENGEIEGLKMEINSLKSELEMAKKGENGRKVQVFEAILDIKRILEQPVVTSVPINSLNSVISQLSAAIAEIPRLHTSQTSLFTTLQTELYAEIAEFRRILEEISIDSKGFFPKNRVSESLESLKNMHNTEIDGIRKEVTAMEMRFMQEKQQISNLLQQLVEIMNYRQAISSENEEEMEKTVQLEYTLVENMLQLVEGETIFEVNESNEVSI